MWVAQLQSALTAKGIRVWIDKDQILPGDRFVDALQHGLESSDSVVLVVSQDALGSSWVQDEYQRALTLSNSSGRNLRLIPLLLADLELPGFLANREYVDFRDGSRFNDAVDLLVRGIRGKAAEGTVPDNSTSAGATTNGSAGVDEVEFLERSIKREERSIRNTWYLRAGALGLGLMVSALVMTLGGALQSQSRLILAVGVPMITGLIGWGATERDRAACRDSIKKLSYLKDGLQLCRSVINPNCGKLHARFWRMVEQDSDA
ncbi:MAG: toll/interleukin-1 receptor domain-containing protein [Acidobacteriia bacterium]|nr:toll/interleukin-1 receptor domain-containing protein [Terriglobia bacterium]